MSSSCLVSLSARTSHLILKWVLFPIRYLSFLGVLLDVLKICPPLHFLIPTSLSFCLTLCIVSAFELLFKEIILIGWRRSKGKSPAFHFIEGFLVMLTVDLAILKGLLNYTWWSLRMEDVFKFSRFVFGYKLLNGLLPDSLGSLVQHSRLNSSRLSHLAAKVHVCGSSPIVEWNSLWYSRF